MIAMALSCDPKILIADEPTTALDVTVQAQILDLINSLKEKYHTSIIFITHDLGVIAETCDLVCVMYLGKVVEMAPTNEIFNNPQHPYTQSLLKSIPRIDKEDSSLHPIEGNVPIPINLPWQCGFYNRCEHGSAKCSSSVPRLDGNECHKVSCFLYSDSEVLKMSGVNYNLIEVKKLSKYFDVSKGAFGRKTGILKQKRVSFHLSKGESLGIVGESGSGKTTLGKCIIRAIQPSHGSILFNNNGSKIDLATASNKELRQVRKFFHMIFQDPFSSLNPTMTVLELIKEPLIYNKIATGDEANELVFDILEEVGLEKKHAHRYSHAFSGGQRQRIGVARSLITKPQLIVCDEPFLPLMYLSKLRFLTS